MPFDLQRFAQADFAPRTQAVPVPGLKAFFGKDDKPEFVVRGLTAAQLHQAIDAKQRQASVHSVVEAIANSTAKASEIKKALGLSTDMPGEIVKRLEMLVAGSVSPVLDMPTAVKLAETFPVEFLSITSTIAELTGQGFDLVKPTAASRKNPASTPK
jgi:hypothetical protein